VKWNNIKDKKPFKGQVVIIDGKDMITYAVAIHWPDKNFPWRIYHGYEFDSFSMDYVDKWMPIDEG